MGHAGPISKSTQLAQVLSSLRGGARLAGRRTGPVRGETRIGAPFSHAPFPASAPKVRSSAGKCQTPSRGRPAATRAIEKPPSGGQPLMKARVPSIGSTTKTRARVRRSSVSAVFLGKPARVGNQRRQRAEQKTIDGCEIGFRHPAIRRVWTRSTRSSRRLR